MASVLPWGPGSGPLLAAVLVGLAVYFALAAWLYAIARRLVLSGERHEGWFVSHRTWEILRQALFYGVLTSGVYALLYAARWVWAPADALLLVPALELLPSLLVLGGIALSAAITLDGLKQLVRYLRGEARLKPKRTMNAQVLGALELTLKYLTYATAGGAAIATVLGAVGFGARFEQALLEFLASRSGAIAFLAVLVGLGWAGGRIVKGLVADVKSNAKRVHPGLVEVAGGVVRYGFYAFLGLIGLFTVLAAIGLGDVGSTIIVVTSTMIGFVVAFAATGSIGNALAGLVILAFRPFNRGDRVRLLANDLTCDVEEVGVMFTRVRTIPGEVVEIPNNLVLQSRVVNLSRSKVHAIVVNLGIGYEVSHALVRTLACEAALKTEGILSDPAPALYATRAGNYAIEYELHAHTRDPRHIATRSALIGHLQEAFYAAGVEIMTPEVRVVRAGKQHEGDGPIVPQVEARRIVPTGAPPGKS